MGKYSYGVILDGGSSGTRVHVYRWLKSAIAREEASEQELHQLPVLKSKKKWTLKVHPGISEYGDQIETVGQDYLKELLDFAQDIVPKDEIQDTPIFFMATAGMRLMDSGPRKALLAEICNYIRNNTKFHMGACARHTQVISGEIEGLFGWTAANYLVGGFDHPKEHNHGKGHHTYGFLEMGGASAQIAFAPNSTEVEKNAAGLNLVRLRTLNGEQSEYQVFVTTFLGYGADEARKRFVEQLTEPVSTDVAVTDPCLPSQLKVTKEGTVIESDSTDLSSTQYLVGNGDFATCLKSTYPLLDKEAACNDPPCLFHGVHVPAIDFDVNHFIGVSNFWHGVHDVFNMGHTDAAYDFHTYQTRVNEFCSKDWEVIQQGIKDDKWGKKFEETDAVEICFKASWLINMLHEGIGIPRVPIEGKTDASGKNGTAELIESGKQNGFLQPFQAVNKIDDNDVDWTLGKMVLYAASQVPPANANVGAVGVGKNGPDQTQGFNHAASAADEPTVPAGGSSGVFYKYEDGVDDFYLPTPGHDEDDDGESLYLHRLFSAENLRRTPGFVVFFVILALIGVLLCGRERRNNLMRKTFGIFRKEGGRGGAIQLGRKQNGRSFFGLGGRRESKYDRLMEEGEIPHPSDFELHTITSSDDDKDSNSSKGSANSASSSGESSSRRKAGAATSRKVASPLPSNPVLDPPTTSTGSGLDRVSTTASSRPGSPSRWRNPSFIKESVD